MYPSLSKHIFSRRLFVKTAAMGSLVFTACGANTNEPPNTNKPVEQPTVAPPPPSALTKAERDALTTDQIIERLKAGNARFRNGQRLHRDLGEELKTTTGAGQFPMAVLLSCIDSRAPAEIIFDLGIGEIFNCRVAGPIENSDILGSLEFATRLMGAKLILVLGHAACGAVSGTISAVDAPITDPNLGNLPALLAKIRPAIKATTFAGDPKADRAKYVDAVAHKNVELTIDRIRTGSKGIADLEKQPNGLKIIGAFFDLQSGNVEFL